MPRALILPLFNILLDQYEGYVINKVAQPHISESDVWDITIFPMPDMDTKMDVIFKSILLIPFLPYYLPLLWYAKHREKGQIARQKFSRALRKQYNTLIGRETHYGRHRQRKETYPDAVHENIPELYKYCKEKQAAIILYSKENPSPEQAGKIQKLINTGIIADFCHISHLRQLAPLLQERQISIPDSALVLSDFMLRLEAEELGFNTGLVQDYNTCNTFLWSESDPWHSNDNFMSNARTSFEHFKHHLFPKSSTLKLV